MQQGRLGLVVHHARVVDSGATGQGGDVWARDCARVLGGGGDVQGHCEARHMAGAVEGIHTTRATPALRTSLQSFTNHNAATRQEVMCP